MWDGEWLRWFGEKILAVLGFLGIGISGALFKRYRSDRAMLLRHEESIASAERELGHCREQRVKTIPELRDEMEREDQKVHDRITATRRELGEVRAAMQTNKAEADANLTWIRRALERIESKL